MYLNFERGLLYNIKIYASSIIGISNTIYRVLSVIFNHPGSEKLIIEYMVHKN